MMILFEARILYQTLTKLVLTSSPLLLVAVRALDFAATSSSSSSSSFFFLFSFSPFFLSVASFSDVPTGLHSFLLFIRAFEGGRGSRQVNKEIGCIEQVKGVKGTKRAAISRNRRIVYSPITLSLIFFCSSWIHRFLSAVSSSTPPRNLGSGEIIVFFFFLLKMKYSIVLINFVDKFLPGLGAGTIARKHGPIVQILEILALQNHGLAIHLYHLQHRIAG